MLSLYFNEYDKSYKEIVIEKTIKNLRASKFGLALGS